MNNFSDYLTPEEAYRINKNNNGEVISLEEFEERAKIKGICTGCRAEEKWRYAGSNLCFSCVTGEWDASSDYELISDFD
jgi:hypothetical protein